MNDDTTLIAFKAIVNFVNDLADAFKRKHRPLKLYSKLISRTQISHDKAITKHIMACQNFCVANRDAILEQNHTKLVEPIISYSPRVFIDMNEIFNLSDAETTPIIWRHILTISAIVDPAGKAKEILKKNVEEKSAPNFLTDFISKVEKSIDPNSTNPMDAVSSIMNSGIFTDLLSSMQGDLSNGKLDLGKILGAVQGLTSSLGDQASGDPQATQLLNGMTSMLGNLGGQGQGQGQVPDMSVLLQTVGTMMSGMNKPQPNIQDISETKI